MLTLNIAVSKCNKARIGTFFKLDKQTLIKYVKQFPLSWVRA